jgi:hypothetical protein
MVYLTVALNHQEYHKDLSLNSTNETLPTSSAPVPTCGNGLSYPYFITFIFLSMFLFLNLFVAVIMDNFDYLTRDSSILGAHHLEDFVQAWSVVDPTGTGRIHHKKVLEMLMQIEPPLGFGKKCQKRAAFQKLVKMNVPVDAEMKVHFNTTLFSLIRVSLSILLQPTNPTGEFQNQAFDKREIKLSVDALQRVTTRQADISTRVKAHRA